MASHTVETAKHSTTTAATVDTITFNGFARYVQIVNRDATDALYVTLGSVNVAPAAPTAAGDDTLVVMPNSSLTVAYPTPAAGKGAVVKVIPGANTPAYSVQLIPDRN